MTPAPKRKLPVDPAWIALAIAALVLIATSAWLASTRPAREQRVEAAPAVEATPAPNPMETQIAELTARLTASEAAVAQLRARPAGDPAALAALRQQVDGRVKAQEDALAQRITEGNAAIGRRLDALEQGVTQRAAATQAVEGRLKAVEDALTQRAAATQAMDGRLKAVEDALTQNAAATQAVDGRLKAVEDALTQRAAADQATARRLEAIERAAADQTQARRLESLERSAAERAAGELALGRRVEAMDQAAAQRAVQAEQALTQRLSALEQSLAERVAPLQDALRRLGATEARTERLSTINALRSLLDAGQPLGSALPRLGGTPPEALARYATAAPPTEAALRLSFEEAVRQARAAPATTQESLTSRLNSLLTVRRGDEVIWGDTSEVQIERARRALEAGDVEGAVAALARLPEANRNALRGWIADAEALIAARAALRSLAAG